VLHIWQYCNCVQVVQRCCQPATPADANYAICHEFGSGQACDALVPVGTLSCDVPVQPDALFVIIPALTLPRWAAVSYIFMFVIGTVAAMGGYTAVIGEVPASCKIMM
jgi:hypothetical protein